MLSIPSIEEDAVVEDEVIRGVKGRAVPLVGVGIGGLELEDLLLGVDVVDGRHLVLGANDLKKSREGKIEVRSLSQVCESYE